MGHFAKVVSSKVKEVIVAEPKFFLPKDQGGDGFVDTSPGQWLQCSYNTRGNVHYGDDGMPDGGVALRGNFPGEGYSHDPVADKFYAPQPFPSWVLNTSTWLWDAPTPMPTDDKHYVWDEPTLAWKELVVPA